MIISKAYSVSLKREVIILERKELIAMRSLTQALKMKDLLAKNGIRSQLVRSPGGSSSSGCGYSLLVTEQTQRAKAIIKSGGAP